MTPPTLTTNTDADCRYDGPLRPSRRDTARSVATDDKPVAADAKWCNSFAVLRYRSLLGTVVGAHNYPAANTGCAGDAVGTPTAAAVAVPERLLDSGEIVLLAIKPSPWFILFVSAKVLILAVIVVLAWPYVVFTAELEQFRPLVYKIATIVALGRLAIAMLQWLHRTYVLTNKRIIRIAGVLHITVFEAPLARIQNTVLDLSLAQRVVRIGTIGFATAGTGVIDAYWSYIAQPLRVYAKIRSAIHHAQQGGDRGL